MGRDILATSQTKQAEGSRVEDDHGVTTEVAPGVTGSRPYDISKTIEELLLAERKCWSYRRVKLLSLSPPAWGGVLPFPVAGCG